MNNCGVRKTRFSLSVTLVFIFVSHRNWSIVIQSFKNPFSSCRASLRDENQFASDDERNVSPTFSFTAINRMIKRLKINNPKNHFTTGTQRVKIFHFFGLKKCRKELANCDMKRFIWSLLKPFDCFLFCCLIDFLSYWNTSSSWTRFLE